MRIHSDLEDERNSFEVHITAVGAEVIESHTATSAAVTNLSAFVLKLTSFGLEGADIDEKVKVALALIKMNAVLLASTEKCLRIPGQSFLYDGAHERGFCW